MPASGRADLLSEALPAGDRVAREVFAGTEVAMTSCWNATLELWDYHRELADGRGHEYATCILLSCPHLRSRASLVPTQGCQAGACMACLFETGTRGWAVHACSASAAGATPTAL